MNNKWYYKTLRIISIVLLSLTALFTLMAGAGTTCVALNPTGFGGGFSGIAPFQWLYILFVLVTLAIGVLGVRAVVQLSKGKQNAYRATLTVLLAGIGVGVVHMLVSRMLRGSSMPVDMVVYTTLLTLVIFLLLRLPSIWQGVNFEKSEPDAKTGSVASAIALGACGLLSLTIQFLMAPTHTVGGFNFSDAWHITLTLIGGGLIVTSLILIFRLVTIPGSAKGLLNSVKETQ